MKADEILQAAADHLRDRAAARDTPEGERSMGKTVAAFNAITGAAMSERDGWMFMVLLKAVRACTTPAGMRDDYEDLAAYAGLAGECAAADGEYDTWLSQQKLPDWARWVVVVGADGYRVVASENRPQLSRHGWLKPSGKVGFVCYLPANVTIDVRDSLRRVP